MPSLVVRADYLKTGKGEELQLSGMVLAER
jgi:hypothetical protein